MYNLSRDTSTCDFCNLEMRFDEHDDVHGDLWGCEECDAIWCTKCFVDRFGRDAFDKMIRENDRIYCPTCYEKHKEEEE